MAKGSNVCTTCGKRIQASNIKRVLCTVCEQPRHLKCTPFVSSEVDVICPLCNSQLFPFNNIDSDLDFFLAATAKDSKSLIDHQLLNNLKLEVKCDFTSSSLTTDDDLDPDSHYYNTLLNNPVNYYETVKLNPITPQPTNGDLQFLMHINARSLLKNLDNLTTELSLLTNKPSIIAVTETWAKTDNDDFPIPGYSNILKARQNRIGGGVALYIQDKIDVKYKLRPDLSCSEVCDSLFIQISIAKTKDIVIGVVYKPPDSDVQKFNEKLEQTLKTIAKEHRPCYLMGDFNINLLNQHIHSPTIHFLDLLLTNGFFPLINKPTRITTDSATLIDNIFTNIHDARLKSGIWVVDISDHLPIFAIRPTKVVNHHAKLKITKRSLTEENLTKFKLDLHNHDWSDLDSFQDVNEMYHTFSHTLLKLYDKAFPLQVKLVRATELHKPWITKSIRNSISKKHRLYKTYQINRSPDSYSLFKAYRNKLTSVLRKAEKMYYLEKLDKVKDNIAKTWKVLNSLISSSPNKNCVEEIVHNNAIVHDSKQIADHFNHFFVNIGPNLAAKIPQSSVKFTSYLETNIPDSLFLKPTDVLEIQQVISSLKNSYSKGHDNLSVNTVKQCNAELSKPLCMIFNKSIVSGIVPDDLKIAKIIPIYKSDDKRMVSNYRPISVLPAFSKIIERLVYNRLLCFIDQRNILSSSQYGFRKNISTSMALLDLVDKISNSIENSEYTLGIFLDLAKAFDTVNHTILLTKLYHYGIRGIPYNWFKNYLSNRHQYVSLNNINSNKLPVTCGVPQGSILGPLLFLLYINDLNTVSKLLTFIMFADDTNIFISGRFLEDLTCIANNELNKISSWFSANLLSLNIKKTNYILFGNKKLPDIQMSINNEMITRVYETKFLGIIIQANLKWTTHIGLLKNKISKSLGIMNKAKNILATAHLKILYRSLIEPYLNYCCIVWASPERTTKLEALHKLQKNAVRIILFAGYWAHTKTLFYKLNIFTIYNLCLSQILTFVYKSCNHLLPIRYINYFTSANVLHQHATRSINNYSLYRTSAQKSCRINAVITRGPKYWNCLPVFLKSAPSLSIFKRGLKEYLTRQYL